MFSALYYQLQDWHLTRNYLVMNVPAPVICWQQHNEWWKATLTPIMPNCVALPAPDMDNIAHQKRSKTSEPHGCELHTLTKSNNE